MNFGKGKSDILFSLICIWAIIFFSAAFTAIGAAASHGEWVLTHAETEREEHIVAESEDEAVEANGDIEIKAEKADDAYENGIRAIISASVVCSRYFGCRDGFRFAQAQRKRIAGVRIFAKITGGIYAFSQKCEKNI